jgi:hypothetical protein
MRQTRGTVPIFSCSGSNRIIRRVGRAEAVRLIEGGSMDMITSGRGKSVEIAALKMKELERETRGSAASITADETFVNALAAKGILQSRTAAMSDREKEAEDIAPDFIEATQDKIEEWPFASLRNKSVTVVPRAAFA